jgi:hypothetical protein
MGKVQTLITPKISESPEATKKAPLPVLNHLRISE